jgi:hypothetical protein
MADVRRGAVGSAAEISISLVRAGKGSDGVAVWQTPRYDAGLALIDLNNDQSRSVEGAYDGSVECQ